MMIESRNDAASLPEFLRRLRLDRHYSQDGLAREAQIGRQTLMRWESGHAIPRLPELRAVLAALNVGDAEGRQAIALLAAPRGRRAVREAARADLRPSSGLPIGGGDLLRAMRLRRRLHLEQVAQTLGIAAGTLSRWERGVVQPPPAALDRLLCLLGAKQPERVALVGGGLHPAPPLPVVDTADGIAALWEQWNAFETLLYSHTHDALMDLGFLALEARAWSMAALPGGPRLLALLFARHADSLLVFRRFGEARHYAERAQGLSEGLPSDDHVVARANVVAAHAAVYAGMKPAPSKGLELLQVYAASRPPRFSSWITANEAEYLSLLGRPRDAVARITQACRLAAHEQTPVMLCLRQRDLAQILLRDGRAEDALPLICLWDGASPTNRAQAALLRAACHVALSRPSAATDQLSIANSDIDCYDLQHLRPQADKTASELKELLG